MCRVTLSCKRTQRSATGLRCEEAASGGCVRACVRPMFMRANLWFGEREGEKKQKKLTGTNGGRRQKARQEQQRRRRRREPSLGHPAAPAAAAASSSGASHLARPI